MATISITAANVLPSSNALRVVRNDGTPTKAFEAFTAGDVAYLHANGTYGLADANAADPIFTPVGIFENSGGAGQVCSIVFSDSALVIGGTLTLGKILILGAAPGDIVEAGDQLTGWHVAVLGIAVSTTTMSLDISPLASGAIA